jgi:MoaA/NifB/PqqE/SkfB family radical SAM enzyme
LEYTDVFAFWEVGYHVQIDCVMCYSLSQCDFVASG